MDTFRRRGSMKEWPIRKNIRLKDYDYSQPGCYFVTICTQNRVAWLGDIAVGQGLCSCRLSEIGVKIEVELLQLEKRYNHIRVAKHIVMPNHIHAILYLDGRREQSPRPTTLADAICAFKSITAKAFNKLNHSDGSVLWQARFHDHIIRSEADYQRIWQYIDENPVKWKEDCYFAEIT